jgi:hypothetical protein
MVCVLYCIGFSLISLLSPLFWTYGYVHFSLSLDKVHITFYVTLHYNMTCFVRLLFLDHALLSPCSLFPSQAASYVFIFHTKRDLDLTPDLLFLSILTLLAFSKSNLHPLHSHHV